MVNKIEYVLEPALERHFKANLMQCKAGERDIKINDIE